MYCFKIITADAINLFLLNDFTNIKTQYKTASAIINVQSLSLRFYV